MINSLITIIVAVVIILCVKRGKDSKIPPHEVKKNTSHGGNKRKSYATAASSSLRDDKHNDWLAKQLRDEHLAFKQTSAMFDLKIEHVSHCDAKIMRTQHHEHCDATLVDNAQGK